MTQATHKQTTVEEEAWASYSGKRSVVVALPDSRSRKKTKPLAYQPNPKASQKAQAEVETTSTTNHLAFCSSHALLLCGALFLYAGLWNSGLPEPSLPTSPPVAQITTKSIQNVQLGDWVKAHIPELDEADQPPFIESIDSELHCVVHLRMQKENGTWLNMQLLRPVLWVVEHEQDGSINQESPHWDQCLRLPNWRLHFYI